MADLYLPTRTPTANGPHRWLSIAAAFADSGGLVSGDELAELIRQQSLHDDRLQVSQPVSLVARWIVSGLAISMDSPWGSVLPLFQFDLQRAVLHPEVPMVCAELRGVLQGVELALWFVTPNEWLEGERPALIMRTRLSEVRRAARHVAQGA